MSVTNATLTLFPHQLLILPPQSLLISPLRVPLEGNYFKITYSTGSTHFAMAGAEVIWALLPESDESSTITRIISILATVLIALICCGCSALCVCKLWRHIKAVSLYDRGGRVAPTLLSRGFTHIDQSVILVSDGSLDLAMPRETFQRELLEVGDAVCTICLDEYSYVGSEQARKCGNCPVNTFSTPFASKNGSNRPKTRPFVLSAKAILSSPSLPQGRPVLWKSRKAVCCLCGQSKCSFKPISSAFAAFLLGLRSCSDLGRGRNCRNGCGCRGNGDLWPWRRRSGLSSSRSGSSREL